MSLQGQVALVTGASRGLGQGIALQLGQAGATVYITGRKPEQSDGNRVQGLPSLEETAKDVTERGGKGIAVYVDHSDMEQVKQLFARIDKETNEKLDILVNNAYSAAIPSGDVKGKKFYEADPEHWDTVNNVGLRNHYFCSVYAARIMVKNRSGLIVNISSRGGLTYLFSVPYGVGKCALDRMASDMAVELRSNLVTCVSLWPGPVRTELMQRKVDRKEITEAMIGRKFSEFESVEYTGKAIVALASDDKKLQLTGRVLPLTDLGDKYGFTDVDGSRPLSLRSASRFLRAEGYRLADFIPAWVKVPGWLMAAYYSAF